MTEYKIRNIIELYLRGPPYWPTWPRRIFILTVPISFPLFLLFYWILAVILTLMNI